MNTTRIAIKGWGAVSPAGWGTESLWAGLKNHTKISPTIITHPITKQTIQTQQPPAPNPRPAFFQHPRLRRSTYLTQYSVGVVFEALTQAARLQRLPERLGLIVCMFCGGVQYTQRFYAETLQNPATASPLLFPETVFNATASHIAATLNTSPLTYTLLGDPATFLEGLALAADWLLDDTVDGCLVVGAEESNWLLSEGLFLFDRHLMPACGAGALYLERQDQDRASMELDLVTDVALYLQNQDRISAMKKVRTQLPNTGLLVDGLQSVRKTDRAEELVWKNWTGPRLSPKKMLGEGLMAASAWQCVTACEALRQGYESSALINVAGCNQKAIGARFLHGAT
jgi:3-oxoacyl-(acyl-carrier-protein) synthase